MYAGLQLPVLKNEQGQDVTRLKPISDVFGLVWRDQRKKMTDSPFLMRHLGISFVENGSKTGDSGEVIPPSNPTYLPDVLIRVDRVAAFLLSINPDKVRAAGNVNGADFLEARNTEWADALHDFIEIGVAVDVNHAKSQELLRKQRASFAQMIGVKNKTADAPDRKALGAVVQQMAAELGIAYQPDLTA